MTNDQVRLVRDSFQQVRDMAEPVGMLFYGRLFQRDPSLRPMFKGDMRVQSTKLMSTLDSLLGALDNGSDVTAVLRELGAKHRGYGVKPEHYEAVRSALLWAMGQALERQFSPEVKAAWSTLIGEVAAIMADESA